MQKLFLFDIDGTLVWTGGAGKKALDRACLCILGDDRASQGVRFDGQTDRVIVRNILNRQGKSVDIDASIDQILEKYLELLPAEIAEASRYTILPGIGQLIYTLDQDQNAFLALATGNLQKGAQIKLARANLFSYFQCGGYGCDHEERSKIVEKAIERSEHLSKKSFSPEAIFVLGDTPHDIAAGKALGVKTVAVATGSFTQDELANCAPSFLFKNFSNTKNFLNTFL